MQLNSLIEIIQKVKLTECRLCVVKCNIQNVPFVVSHFIILRRKWKRAKDWFATYHGVICFGFCGSEIKLIGITKKYLRSTSTNKVGNNEMYTNGILDGDYSEYG